MIIETAILALAGALAGDARLRKAGLRDLEARLHRRPRPTGTGPERCDRRLPRGTRLFHGTSEPYPALALRPGGDGFTWFSFREGKVYQGWRAGPCRVDRPGPRR